MLCITIKHYLHFPHYINTQEIILNYAMISNNEKLLRLLYYYRYTKAFYAYTSFRIMFFTRCALNILVKMDKHCSNYAFLK